MAMQRFSDSTVIVMRSSSQTKFLPLESYWKLLNWEIDAPSRNQFFFLFSSSLMLQYMQYLKIMDHFVDANVVGIVWATIWEENALLQNEDCSENDPHLVLGFLCLGSGMSPEEILSESEPVGSEEIRQAWWGRLKCDSPFC